MITSTHYQGLQHLRDIEVPIRLHETPSENDALRSVGLCSIIALLIVAPPAIIYAIFQLSEANFSSMAAAAQNLAGVSAAAIVFAMLFGRSLMAALVKTIRRRRITTINENQVTVREQTLFRSKEWREPLAEYCGVESQMQMTVNGWKQTLVLSHPLPDRQVSLWVGEQVPDKLVASYESLLSRASRQ